MSFLMSYFGILQSPVFKKVKIAPQFPQIIYAALFAPRYTNRTNRNPARRPAGLVRGKGGLIHHARLTPCITRKNKVQTAQKPRHPTPRNVLHFLVL